MNFSKLGCEYLAEREGGMRLNVHDDGYGFPTVGVGHLVLDDDHLVLGDTISLERGNALLLDDVSWASDAVNQYVVCPLIQCQFDALVVFCFNVGQTAFRRSTLVRQLNSQTGDACAIAREQMPRWNRSGGQRSRGLRNRRIDTAQMFCKGDYTVDWSGLDGQT